MPGGDGTGRDRRGRDASLTSGQHKSQLPTWGSSVNRSSFSARFIRFTFTTGKLTDDAVYTDCVNCCQVLPRAPSRALAGAQASPWGQEGTGGTCRQRSPSPVCSHVPVPSASRAGPEESKGRHVDLRCEKVKSFLEWSCYHNAEHFIPLFICPSIYCP